MKRIACAAILAMNSFVPAAGAQVPGQAAGTQTAGTWDAPIPAADPNGNPMPGCLIAFHSPPLPGNGPDFPCLIECPGTAKMDLATFNEMCGAIGPAPEGEARGGWVTEPGVVRRRLDGTLYDSECLVVTGPKGYKNWHTYFPKGHERCAGVSGEPHVSTFDKVRYDLQAAGEFVAAASADDDLHVQLRLEPVSQTAQVSVVTAAAARLGRYRVTVAAGREAALHVDGRPLALDEHDNRILEGAGGIVRTGPRYSLVWPDGTNLHVDVFRRHLNVWMLPALERDGRLVGLLGNADGDGGANDFRTRDGRAIASLKDFETRYRVFADSWRVRSEESLFDYEPGQSTETFTRRDFPAREVTAPSLDAAARTRAEALCRAAGVTAQEALDECVFDVALTGDETYVESALSQQAPPELVETDPAVGAGAEDGMQSATGGGITLTAPREVIASFPVEVRVSGPTPAGDTIAIARADAADPAHVTQARVGEGPDERTIQLIARNESGPYEFRYKTAASGWRAVTLPGA